MFCRVRPLLPFETERGASAVVRVSDDHCSVKIPGRELPKTRVAKKGTKNPDLEFVFDICFPPGTSQEEVFVDTKRCVIVRYCGRCV